MGTKCGLEPSGCHVGQADQEPISPSERRAGTKTVTASNSKSSQLIQNQPSQLENTSVAYIISAVLLVISTVIVVDLPVSLEYQHQLCCYLLLMHVDTYCCWYIDGWYPLFPLSTAHYTWITPIPLMTVHCTNCWFTSLPTWLYPYCRYPLLVADCWYLLLLISPVACCSTHTPTMSLLVFSLLLIPFVGICVPPIADTCWYRYQLLKPIEIHDLLLMSWWYRVGLSQWWPFPTL